jgi:hypothetical protein
MDTQAIIVIALVSAATIYLLRILLLSAKGHSCASGKCGCEKPLAPKEK